MVTIIKKGTPKDKIKKRVAEVVAKVPKNGIRQYAGKLPMEIDPLEYQRNVRNERE
ncbi:hypothetical protein [Adhaeribacter arboris]|uniref:hypothetical protein n=1 Tax=Adhaeribacter arboris TaxID=2072846 RepID=UPI001304E8C7|nr:hypothetical protein [Adhaeribacter arboris]